MRRIIALFLVVVMVVSSASFALADVNQNQNVGVTTTMNPTLNAQQTNIQSQYSNTQSSAFSGSRSDANAFGEGGDANATGGKSILNFNYNNPREFINGIGTYPVGLIGGPSTNGHHRTAQAAGTFRLRMRMNQVSFDSMKNYLVEANKIDSSTRDWEDLRDDLVVQPKFNFPRAALSDQEFVFVVDAASINFANINEEDVVGFVTVRDKKPRENSVDKMYMVDAVYPYAKIGGVNLLIKVDDYFWVKVKSGSWGAGIGGILSTIFSCFTGGAGSINGGYSSGSSMEHVAGGEMYLALHIPPTPPPAPCPPPPPPPAPEPEKCNPKKFQERIIELEQEVQKCTRYCFNNLKLRYALEKTYIDLYVCTGEKRYLDSAIYNAEVAERNYLKGYDIAAHRAEADQVISEVWYFQAGAINIARGERAASGFATSKKLERYPKRFAR